MCSCGNCYVDGGHEYLQRNYITNTPEEAFEELSEYQNSPMKKSTDYSKYWLTQSQIEALRQDSKEASLYYAEKFSKILEEKLGYKKKINR